MIQRSTLSWTSGEDDPVIEPITSERHDAREVWAIQGGGPTDKAVYQLQVLTHARKTSIRCIPAHIEIQSTRSSSAQSGQAQWLSNQLSIFPRGGLAHVEVEYSRQSGPSKGQGVSGTCQDGSEEGLYGPGRRRGGFGVGSVWGWVCRSG